MQRRTKPPRAASCASIAPRSPPRVGSRRRGRSSRPAGRPPTAADSTGTRGRDTTLQAARARSPRTPRDPPASAPARARTIARASSPVQRARRPRARSARASPRSSGNATLARRSSARAYIASPSGVWRSSGSRMRCRYAAIGVSSKPSRASSTAGANELRPRQPPPARDAPPRARSAVPGTATAAGPVWNTCCVSPSKSTASSSSSPRPPHARGTATKKSSTGRAVRRSARAGTRRRPAPSAALSTTHDMNAAAQHASTALPPRSSTSRARRRGERMPGCDRSFCRTPRH